jgi:hypothetical protein
MRVAINETSTSPRVENASRRAARRLAARSAPSATVTNARARSQFITWLMAPRARSALVCRAIAARDANVLRVMMRTCANRLDRFERAS